MQQPEIFSGHTRISLTINARLKDTETYTVLVYLVKENDEVTKLNPTSESNKNNYLVDYHFENNAELEFKIKNTKTSTLIESTPRVRLHTLVSYLNHALTIFTDKGTEINLSLREIPFSGNKLSFGLIVTGIPDYSKIASKSSIVPSRTPNSKLRFKITEPKSRRVVSCDLVCTDSRNKINEYTQAGEKSLELELNQLVLGEMDTPMEFEIIRYSGDDDFLVLNSAILTAQDIIRGNGELTMKKYLNRGKDKDTKLKFENVRYSPCPSFLSYFNKKDCLKFKLVFYDIQSAIVGDLQINPHMKRFLLGIQNIDEKAPLDVEFINEFQEMSERIIPSAEFLNQFVVLVVNDRFPLNEELLNEYARHPLAIYVLPAKLLVDLESGKGVFEFSANFLRELPESVVLYLQKRK